MCICIIYIYIYVDTPFISLLASCEPWLGILAGHYSNWTNFEPSAAVPVFALMGKNMPQRAWSVCRHNVYIYIYIYIRIILYIVLNYIYRHIFYNIYPSTHRTFSNCALVFHVHATSLVRKLEDVRSLEVIGLWRSPKHLLTDWSINRHQPELCIDYLGCQLHNKCSSKNALVSFSHILFPPAQRKPTAAWQ